jgi:hypothetical protein
MGPAKVTNESHEELLFPNEMINDMGRLSVV